MYKGENKMKVFYAVATAAVMLSSCANANQNYTWKPTDPSFGHNQAIVQHAFCSTLFRGFQNDTTDPDTQKLFNRLANLAEARLAALSSGRDDEAAKEEGTRQATAYPFEQSTDQVIAASDTCLDVVLGRRVK